jgi:hypothetical protein
MSLSLQVLDLVLDWTAAIAWPFVTLVIVLIVRKPAIALLGRIDTVAQRAETEAFDVQLGERLKISFRQALKAANPKTVAEAVQVAEQEADRAITIFNLLGRMPLEQHHKDLLLKVARGGAKGIHWQYGGREEDAPGRTMSQLLAYGLVRREGDRYYTHPLVREYIFSSHATSQDDKK